MDRNIEITESSLNNHKIRVHSLSMFRTREVILQLFLPVLSGYFTGFDLLECMSHPQEVNVTKVRGFQVVIMR